MLVSKPARKRSKTIMSLRLKMKSALEFDEFSEINLAISSFATPIVLYFVFCEAVFLLLKICKSERETFLVTVY